MRVLNELAMADKRADTLAILLPGALEQPEKFREAGFPQAVRRRRLALDLALADPALEFIGEATGAAVLDRLHQELLQPARQAGYGQIWLCGISIGGLMTLAHAARYPGAADGLCLLAPYPGNRILTREIMAAGGAAAWRALTARESGTAPVQGPKGPADLASHAQADEDGERLVWRWLGAFATPATTSIRMPHIHMGYGRDDRFASGLDAMAQVFDPAAIDVLPGGHDWPTWRRLWDNFLDRNGWRFGTTVSRGESA
jgi:pimeloyl-ACP methyl ester carboxylesterase